MRFTRRMPALLPRTSRAVALFTQTGSADKGRRRPERWCSDCHAISAPGPYGRDPTSLAAIAIYRSAGQFLSRMSLPGRHDAMRRIARILDLHAVDGLVASIGSLDRPLGMPPDPN